MTAIANWRLYSPLKNVFNKSCDYDDDLIDSIRALGEDSWVVQEKAEGAQLSFFYNNDTYRFCVRPPSYSVSANDLYDLVHTLLNDRLKARISTLFDSLGAKEYIAIHGILIGGNYPHEKVVPIPTSINASKTLPLSKKIFYGPNNLFYAFDIEVDGRYLNPQQVIGAFYRTNFLHAPIRMIASFDACIKSDVDFITEIPLQLGLPPIDKNFSAGIVIRPTNNLYDENQQRIILKKECVL